MMQAERFWTGDQLEENPEGDPEEGGWNAGCRGRRPRKIGSAGMERIIVDRRK